MIKRFLSAILLMCIILSACTCALAEEDEKNYKRLELGAYSNEVRAVQQRLKDLGYLTGSVDGSYWTQTKNAIMRFQQQNYLVVTEKYIDVDTLKYLFSDEAEPANKVVCKLGQAGNTIRVMQECLYNWGFFQAKIDATYGSGTAAAVAEFQATIWEREWDKRHAEGGIPFSKSNFDLQGNSVDSYIYQYFIDKNYTFSFTDLKIGDKGPGVARIQNILYNYGYLWREPDNSYDYFTQAAVTWFQKKHGLPQTGIADEATQKHILEGDIVKCVKPAHPYRLVVNVDEQRVYAYAWDGESYSSVVRIMICSTGKPETPTPPGIYTETYPLNVWHHFLFYHCYAQYSYVIDGGVMFHSVLYYERTEKNGQVTHGYVDRPSVENLGTRQSHGCVRLPVEDARWIFNNCPRNTEVEVLQLIPDPVIEDK